MSKHFGWVSEYYPWNPDGPLCPLLAEPEVWANVYPKSRTRRAVKNILKRRRGAFPPDGPVSIFIDSDERFGKALVWYLKTSRGRHALLSYWEREHGRTESRVPSYELDLYRSVSKEFDLPPNVLPRGSSHKFLDPAGLSELLETKGLPQAPDARTFALLATAAAMRQQSDAKEILGCLADYDTRFVAWFGLESVSAELKDDESNEGHKLESVIQQLPMASVSAPREPAPQVPAPDEVGNPPSIEASSVVLTPQSPNRLLRLNQPHLLSESEFGELISDIQRRRVDLLHKLYDAVVAHQDFQAAIRRMARLLRHPEAIAESLAEPIPPDAQAALIEALHRNLPKAREHTEALSNSAREIARLEGDIRRWGGAVPPLQSPATPVESTEQLMSEARTRMSCLARVNEQHIIHAERVERLRREFKSLEGEGGRRGKLYSLEAEEWELLACDALGDPELRPLVWAASRLWLSTSGAQGGHRLSGVILAEACKGGFPHADMCRLVGWLPRQGLVRWLGAGGGEGQLVFFAFLRATFELGRSDFLEVLAPFLERYGAVGNFVDVIHRLHLREQIGLSDVLAALADTTPRGGGSTKHCEALRQNFILPVPGGGGNYARLRIYVWKRFLRPLSQALLDRDVTNLRRTAVELKDSHAVCEEARSAAEKGRNATIRDTHLDKTQEFVRDARSAIVRAVDELERYSGGRAESRRAIAAAWSKVQESNSVGVETAAGLQACVRRWLVTFQSDGLARDDQIAQDFQDWKSEDYLQQFWRLELPPWARRCWRMKWRGVRARVEDALCDLLGRWAGGGVTPRQHVEHFHATGNLSAARAACRYWAKESLGQCAEQIEEAFLDRTNALDARVKRLHHGATTNDDSPQGEFEAEIEEIETALRELRLEVAEEDLEIVEQLVEDSHRESEEAEALRPIRAYLERAGIDVAGERDLEKLRRRREELREDNADRMAHIRSLRGFDKSAYPPELRESARVLADRLDDPASWPDGSIGLQLGEAISGSILILKPLFHMRDQMSPEARADIDVITAGLCSWFLACEHDDLGVLEDVFLEIATLDQPYGAEVRGVLANFSLCAPPESYGAPSVSPPEVPSAIAAPEGRRVRPSDLGHPSAIPAEASLRRRPPRRLQDAHVPPDLQVDHQALEAALRVQDFAAVRQQSAGLWPRATDGPYRAELVAYFCVADLLSPSEPLSSATEVALRAREASIWLAQSWSRSRVSLPGMLVEVIAIGLRASSAGPLDDSGKVAELLDVDWEGNRRALLDLLEEDAAGAHWLIWVSRHAAGHKEIARALYELFKQTRLRFSSQQHNRVRFRLLELLRKGGAWSVLEALLLEIGRNQQEFSDIVRALEEAASGRDVSGTLLALAKHLGREVRVPGWNDPLHRFIQSALTTRPDAVSPIEDIRFEGELEVIGPGLVEGALLVVPRDDSRPRSVILELPEGLGIAFRGGKVRHSVYDSSAMFRPHRVDVCFLVQKAFLDNGGMEELPLRVTGKTLTGLEYGEVRTLQARLGPESAFVEFLESEIRPHFPAARGAAAKPNQFLGRESTLAHLEACLIKESHPGTLTIFGPRRVGKTSLLLRFLSDYAYGCGRVNDLAVLYFDLEGWHLPEDPSQLDASFYRSFLRGMKRSRNRGLFGKLEAHVGTGPLQELGRREDPEASLSELLEDYLNGLLELAKGQVGRVILIFDEGDKLVQPYLARSETYHRHINAVLGQLRSISQHLPDVGLVLAGTDLMRRLMNEYHQPFFASTEQLTIGGLDWETELSAIRRLVFPPAVGQKLRVEDETLKYVFDLTGGIPYYLACVGYAIAALSRRAHVTIPSVNRAVEMIMTDQVPGTLQLNPAIFIKPLETLASLGSPRDLIAELILYKLSEEIALDFPTASPAHILDDEELLERVGGNERELRKMMQDLQDCQFIEVVPGQLCFQVPIFGHALRFQSALRIPTLLEQTEQS